MCEKGSLVLDAIAASNEVLIWRAAALAHIVVDVGDEGKFGRKRAAIDTLFEEFPPKNVPSPSA